MAPYSKERREALTCRVLRKLPSKGRWRMSVSSFNRSLALEEVSESVSDHEDLLHLRHLYISNASTEKQPVLKVVKVSGSITVSF